MKSFFRRAGCLFAVASLLLTCCSFVGCGRGQTPLCLYRICADLDEQEMRLTAEQRLDYVNTTDTEVTELRFHLYGRAYREGASLPPVTPQNAPSVYPKGEDYGDMEVGQVTDGKSNPLPYEITGEDAHVLCVTLSKGLFPNERTTVVIPFSVQLACIRHRLGYTDRAVNLGNWYPVLCVRERGGDYECAYAPYGDPFYSVCADYEVELTCDAEYVLASSGTVVGEKQSDERKTYDMQLKRARDFAMVLSKDFTVHTSRVGETDVKYYCYADDKAGQTLQTAKDALAYFDRAFGEYPYPTYAVVQTPFLAGGMEYPALVYISDQLKGVDIDTVVVHETAHQWWYGIVGNNQMQEAWLDEGLSEYATCLFFENHPAYGISREQTVRDTETAYRAFVSVTRQNKGQVDTTMRRNLRAFSSEYEYVNVTYNGGFLLFDGLRQSVGDRLFFKALRRYYGENAYGVAGQDDLIGAFERAGVKVRGYVESYTNGKIWFEK